MCVYVCVCMRECMFAMGYMWSSRDNLQQLFLSFHHMSPKSGALRLGTNHFLTYRAILPAPGLCKLRLFYSIAKHISASQHWTCSPWGITWCLKSPKLSHPVSFFQLILQVSYYLSWTSTCCFFFFFDVWGKKTKKKSHIFILLQNIICDL